MTFDFDDGFSICDDVQYYKNEKKEDKTISRICIRRKKNIKLLINFYKINNISINNNEY